jgi:hypothetical protein
MANKYHVRSISLPSRSHPSTIRVDEDLNKLKTWEGTSTSTSTSRSIHNGLSLLENLYISLEDLLNMTSTQQVISHHRGEKSIEEVLDGSMRILDLCGITRDTILQIKENVQVLHSSIRRRKCDSSVEKSVMEYKHFTKKMKKNVNKLIKSLKHIDSKFGVSSILELDHHFSSMIRVYREVIVMNMSIFQFILSFLTPSSSKSKSTKWLFMTKLMHKGVITCEDHNLEINANELQCVEGALNTLLIEGTNGENLHATRERLEALENVIESVENGLENLFRRLIKSRASLLNIISQ